MSDHNITKFSEFNFDIDQEIPFGLKIKINEESEFAEEGTICLLPHKVGAPLHKHSEQDEVFTVIEGELFAQVGEKKLTLKAGDSVTFPKHTPHTYANKSDQVCVFKYRLTPGGDFTKMMRTLEELGHRGKLTRIGEPKTMVHLAAVISKHDHHVRSVNPPHFVMKTMGLLSRFL